MKLRDAYDLYFKDPGKRHVDSFIYRESYPSVRIRMLQYASIQDLVSEEELNPEWQLAEDWELGIGWHRVEREEI